MRYVLPKEKKQRSDVNAFDWLNLGHLENGIKGGLWQIQNLLFRSSNNRLGPLSSYPLQKTSIQSSSCNSPLLPSQVANSRIEVAPLQRRSTEDQKETLAPENVFEHAIDNLTVVIPKSLLWGRRRRFPASNGKTGSWSGRRWRHYHGSSGSRSQSPSTQQVPVEVLRLFRPLGETLPCCLPSERVEWRSVKWNSANKLDWSRNRRVLHISCAFRATGSRKPTTNTPDSIQWVQKKDPRLHKLEEG